MRNGFSCLLLNWPRFRSSFYQQLHLEMICVYLALAWNPAPEWRPPDPPPAAGCANLALRGVQTFSSGRHNLLECESRLRSACGLMSTEMRRCGLCLPDRRSAPPPLTHTKVYCMTPVSHSVSQSRFLNAHAASQHRPVCAGLICTRSLSLFPHISSSIL